MLYMKYILPEFDFYWNFRYKIHKIIHRIGFHDDLELYLPIGEVTPVMRCVGCFKHWEK